MKDDRVYLRHILECIDAVRSYTAGSGRDAFFNDRMTQKAILRELQELAASTQRLSAEARAKHPEIPWQDISGFRNVLVHDYLGLSLERVWSIIDNDLAPLEAAARGLLHELEAQP